MNEQKNLILALVASMAILFGYNHFFVDPKVVQNVPQSQQIPMVSTPPVTAPLHLSHEDAISKAPRVAIQTDSVTGSLNLKGLVFDDLALKKYHETIEATSPIVKLLQPLQTKDGLGVVFSWVSADPALTLPTHESQWSLTKGVVLTPSSPITVSWNNGSGQTFEATITIDADYMFAVEQRVINAGTKPITVAVKGDVVRLGKPQASGLYLLYEGPLGVFNGKLQEIDYDTLTSKKNMPQATAKSWIGITDKYWLTALIPDQTKAVPTSFKQAGTDTAPTYNVDFTTEPTIVAAGGTFKASNHFFAGAKTLNLLDSYEAALGIEHFDYAVDFGIFYFLTKPIFHALLILQDFLGNFGLAILVLTVAFKALFYPLAAKSYRSMGMMKLLQPEIEKLKERYGDDRLKLNEQMMALYKKQKVNPLAGCLPMLVQIPVFFALYKVLFITIEMRHAPFFGWIQDLSAPDPTTIFNLFGLIHWTPPAMLMLGAWPILMGATMLVQQWLNPPPADPVQAKVMMAMPIIFTYMLAQFPAGLVIYWAWNNLLSIAQQWLIMREVAASKLTPAVASKR